jgi:hypothetical protein
MRMQAWDQSGAGVMCVDIWFRVAARPSAAAAASAAAGLPGAAGRGDWAAAAAAAASEAADQDAWPREEGDARLQGRRWMRPRPGGPTPAAGTQF